MNDVIPSQEVWFQTDICCRLWGAYIKIGSIWQSGGIIAHLKGISNERCAEEQQKHLLWWAIRYWEPWKNQQAKFGKVCNKILIKTSHDWENFNNYDEWTKTLRKCKRECKRRCFSTIYINCFQISKCSFHCLIQEHSIFWAYLVTNRHRQKHAVTRSLCSG